MKNKKGRLGRQVVFSVVWLILGIIGGNMLLQKQYVSFFCFLLCLMAAGVGCGVYYGKKAVMLLVISIGVGGCVLYHTPLHQEEKIWQDDSLYTIKGKVLHVSETDYGKWVVMGEAAYLKNHQWISLKSQLQCKLLDSEAVRESDQLLLKARKATAQKQMNPSDFDTSLYLKAQGIAATFEAEKLIACKSQHHFLLGIKTALRKRIEQCYDEKYEGVMAACLLGDTQDLETTTKAIYNASGISHVLSISGFHVGVILSLLTVLMGLWPISYGVRQLLLMAGIWGYAVLTGSSISTLRAVIMASFMLAGRGLWQEEDGLTNLALAAGVILIDKPYQLFQPGFQLSFGVVASIFLCMQAIERKELSGQKNYKKWEKSFMMWLCIQLVTWPILAYHFYEVPFWISLINLAVIPLFSLIIIGGWLSLFIAGIWPALGVGISSSIQWLLAVIEKITAMLLNLPLATLCVGRPKLISFSLYLVGAILLLSRIFGGFVSKKIRYGIGMGIALYFLACYGMPGALKMTALYVGQGDAMVMELPHHDWVVIDGGNQGKGKVLSQFIKYHGGREIAAIFLSHSDADHLMGLLELLDTNIHVKQVFISQADHSVLLDTFLQKCHEKKMRVTRLAAGDQLQIDGVKISCLAPFSNAQPETANDVSCVQLVEYGRFKALFTGDKSKDSDTTIYNTVGPITLLKVSHHGSRTGTNQALLLKLQPLYAVISCGIHNSYGHPHKEVLSCLNQEQIQTDRTDEEGAITYITDGRFIKCEPFIIRGK